MPDEQMMDLKDVAKYLKKSERWVRREVFGKGIKFYRVGRDRRVYKSELDAWVKQQLIYPD
jgi:excisionase family DNA binding protein